MSRSYLFWNSRSGKRSRDGLEALKAKLNDDELDAVDVIGFAGYREYLSGIQSDDRIYLIGGDGTLNRFANETDGMNLTNDIYYYPAGTGNDFLKDLEKTADDCPLKINQYLENLPVVEVNGKKYRFLNGIGYGIDGYCCEVGDRMKAENKENINYTSIAIKGLLFHYHPTSCTITVDGKKYEYKKVWLCPTMNGRYYGGGMMAAPGQDRLSKDGTLSAMLFYGKGRLSTLMAFPSIFKGEHINHHDMVAIHTGKDITVEFDSPTSLQIDGETILGVTKYRAYSVR
jgi:diacylglycerol kinase (ATP)